VGRLWGRAQDRVPRRRPRWTDGGPAVARGRLGTREDWLRLLIDGWPLLREVTACQGGLTAAGGLPDGQCGQGPYGASGEAARGGTDLEAPWCAHGLGACDLGRARASGRRAWGRGPAVRRVRRGAGTLSAPAYTTSRSPSISSQLLWFDRNFLQIF
jgi:hypothetical protein